MFNVYADGQSIHFPLDRELIITKPKLTLEMGKAGSFEFSIPPTNRFYSRLQQLKTIITVEYDDIEIFRGRVLTNSRGFNNVRKIYCEGNLAYLVDSVQKGEKYSGTTHDLFRRIVANHNSRVEAEKQFTVGNITIENREIFIAGTSDEIQDIETKKFDYKQIAINSMVDDWNTSFDYIQNTIIDYCGGYLRTRRVGNTTYLDLLKDYGSTSIQKIEFGKNLIDLTEEVKAEDVFTVLIPLGDDNLTIASVNGGSDELVDQAGVARYGRIVKTNVFDSVNKAETLLENGQRMLANHENMPITITVKAVDMHLVDNSSGRIYVGDKVYVNSIPHDITDYLTCTKIEYDLENHANDTYTFGNPKQTMTERYKKDKAKSTKSGRGRSGGGSGGASAAADAAAEDYAVSEADKMGKEIFDAYIQVDPAAGKITLAALYAQVENGFHVLENNVGINLNAPAGTVDIFSMNKMLTDHGHYISSSEARIQTLADSQQAQITEFTNFKTRTSESITSITQRTTANEASISLNAKYIKGNTDKIAAIEINANKMLSSINLKADLTTVNSKINAVNADINTINSKITTLNSVVTNVNSMVTNLNGLVTNVNTKVTNINSDVTNINGRLNAVEGKFKNIDSDFAFAGILRVKSTTFLNSSVNIGGNVTVNNDAWIKAKTIYQDGKKVATESWVNEQLKKYASSTHKHTVSIGHYHKVTVKSLNTETSTGGVENRINVTKTTSTPT